MLEITFLGRGGQGAFTSSRILGAAASLYEGKHSLSFPSFGPERRGAPVFAYTKIGDTPIRDRSQSTKSDYIVILDESLYSEALLLRLKENGKVIINSVNPSKYTATICGTINDSPINNGSINNGSISNSSINNGSKKILTFGATEIATEFLGSPITNTAMLAVLVCHTQMVSLSSVIKAINGDLSPKIAVKNQRLVEYIAAQIGGAAYV